MRRKFPIALAIIVVVIAGTAATYFLTTPTSPYLAELRSRPENFLSYTKILYVLVKNKSGRTVAKCQYDA